MCTMAINNQFNGIELTFESMPSAAIRDAMKSAGFRWHSQKKLWYAKNTAERLALATRLSKNPAAAPEAPAQVAAAAPVEPVSNYGIKAGDILFDTWGYSMTIVDYYKVTKIVSPSKIEIVKIGCKVIDTDRGGGEHLMPDPENELRERMVKQVVKNRYDGSWYIKISESVRLRPWDGRAHYQNTWD